MKKTKGILRFFFFVFLITQIITLPAFGNEKADLKLNQSLVEENKKNYKEGETFNLSYKIDKSNGILKSEYDKLYKKDKEIVLVVDTSGSMNSPLEKSENTIYNIEGWRMRLKIKTHLLIPYFIIEKEVLVKGRWIEVNGNYFDGQYVYIDNEKYYVEGNKCYKSQVETRLDSVKRVTNNFIDKISKDYNGDNIKIGVVSYSSKGNEDINITNDFGAVKESIDNLTAKGGTNIGDGIRKAYNMLGNKKNTEKYVILMTDGFPTAFTSYKKDLKYTKSDEFDYEFDHPNDIFKKVLGEIQEDGCISYFKEINGYSFKLNRDDLPESYVVNYGDNDHKDIAMKYSLEAAKQAKNRDINNFVIGFSEGINSDKLKSITYNAGGYYKEAKDENTLNDIYNKIADKIKLPIIKNIRYRVDMPEGLVAEEVNALCPEEILNLYIEEGGRRIFGVLDDINYTKIQDGKYVVNPLRERNINLNVKVKGVKKGDYTLKDAYITYSDIDGSETKKFFSPHINFSISEGESIFKLEKFGLFLKRITLNQGIDKYLKVENIELFNEMPYELGSILQVYCEDEGEKGKFIKDKTNMKIYTQFNGKTQDNIKDVELYHFDPKKYILEKVDIIISKGEIIVPKGKLIKGDKYILTQDFTPNSKETLSITNNIIINKKDKLTKNLSVKLIEVLPDVE